MFRLLVNSIQGWAIKNVPLFFCSYLHQKSTDFQNSFTDALCGQLATKSPYLLAVC